MREMHRLKPDADAPQITLFDDQNELCQELGAVGSHGYFDPATNTIYATPQSLPHEIAHFKDFKSGRMLRPEEITDPEGRDRARIRNEIVAVLYAWKKNADVRILLKHEKLFLDWFHYVLEKGQIPFEDNFKSWRFQLIQDCSDWLVSADNTDFLRLAGFFHHYLESTPLALRRFPAHNFRP